MSRNNLLVVVEDRRRRCVAWHVLLVANADDGWNEGHARRQIRRGRNRRFGSYAAALLHAHRRDRRVETEYGVRDLVLWPPLKPKSP